MKCNDALDMVYESEEALPLGKRLSVAFHIILCGQCAAHLGNYEKARFLLKTEFFPPSPDFSDSIMNSIYREDEEYEEEASGHLMEAGGFSVRGWVIAGLALIISLATIFFGQDFASIVRDQGSSYLIPLGILIGVAITVYGALFIGSHLKEFSEKFKLKF